MFLPQAEIIGASWDFESVFLLINIKVTIVIFGWILNFDYKNNVLAT